MTWETTAGAAINITEIRMDGRSLLAQELENLQNKLAEAKLLGSISLRCEGQPQPSAMLLHIQYGKQHPSLPSYEFHLVQHIIPAGSFRD